MISKYAIINEVTVALASDSDPPLFSAPHENGIVLYEAAMHLCETEYLETGSE